VPNDLLEGLNGAQRRIVLHDQGPVLAAAVAGAGKTHAVVHRIAYLVQERCVDPRRILAITFTKAGADEMNKRLLKMGVKGAEVRTFHSLAYGFCTKHFPEHFGTELDVEGYRFTRMVKHALSYRELDLERFNPDPSDIQLVIETFKENLVSSNEALDTMDYHGMVIPAQVYDRTEDYYEHLLEGRHLAGLTAPFFTFADLMYCMGTQLHTNGVLRAQWQKKWDYVIQDEAQDQSRAQFVIGAALASVHENYMVVGDPSQCVYSWRGAAPHMLKTFADDWHADVILMNLNYRSGENIIAAANHALAHVDELDKFEGQRVEQARECAPGVVVTREYPTMHAEADEVVADIAARIKAGTRPRDICVLYRLNVQGAALEDSLCRVKVPYRITGAVNLYDRAEIKCLLSYLRLVIGAGTSDDLVVAARRPYRYFSKRLLSRLGNFKYNPGLSFSDQLWDVGEDMGLKPGSLDKWHTFISNLDEWREFFDEDIEADACELLGRIIKDTDYIKALEKSEGALSVANTREINITRFSNLAECFSVIGLLAYVKEMRKHIKDTRKSYSKVYNAVQLSTIHKAKGLEWPIVYVIGCNNGLLPFSRGNGREEARLFYVATTRARDELVYTYAEFGMYNKEVERSRFLPPDPREPAFGESGWDTYGDPDPLDFGRSLM